MVDTASRLTPFYCFSLEGRLRHQAQTSLAGRAPLLDALISELRGASSFHLYGRPDYLGLLLNCVPPRGRAAYGLRAWTRDGAPAGFGS